MASSRSRSDRASNGGSSSRNGPGGRDSREGRSQPLGPGDQAPDFRLPTTPDQLVSLDECRGGPLVLVFYPADWSPVCGDQLALYNELLPEFRKHGASLLAISCDGIWCHLAYEKERKLRFPLLSDFQPKGAVARQYGVYREDDGVCERALFVLDADGTIAWSYVSPVGINPGADGILEALENLSEQKPDVRAGAGRRGEPSHRVRSGEGPSRESGRAPRNERPRAGARSRRGRAMKGAGS